ncbi:MAG: hypothetical protein JXR37_10755 [Kiritimatiellae bacterium]|nr:hypothetical protein [Kiritimatiellia bacterium]
MGIACDVRNFGATGDGQTPEHDAIQRALDACSARGGGTVTVPPGAYACGSIVLKSGVTLHLARNAVISAIPDPALYPRHRALLYAGDATDLGLTGHGTVLGTGDGPVPKPKPKGRLRSEQDGEEVIQPLALRRVDEEDVPSEFRESGGGGIRPHPE